MKQTIDVPKELESNWLTMNHPLVDALIEAFQHANCLSCSHSMSADEDGEQILVCSKQNYKRVDEEDCCWEYL